MTALAERLLRATVYAAFDARDRGDRAAFRDACRRVVDVHRAGPLVDHAERLQEAVDAVPAIEAVVFERTAMLEAELRLARRAATIAWARVAVLEPLLGEVPHGG